MAIVYPTSAGGGSDTSINCTATRANVLETKTAITSDSNDNSMQGTLPLAAVRLAAGGTLQINGADSFSVSQSLTTPNTVVFNFSATAKTGQPWGGLYIRCRDDRFPNSVTDGTECGYFSQSGSTYTFSAGEYTKTYYFRAWNFFRYNETITSPQTYPLIEYGTYISRACEVKSHPVPYILSYGGNLNSTVTGNFTIPIGYTHADVAVVAVGGYSGTAYSKDYETGSSFEREQAYYINYGRAGGEGGQVRILSLSCSPGQTMSWTIGKAGTKGSAKYTSTSSGWGYYSSPFTQGSAGENTSFTFNGNTYTSIAGNNGESAYSGASGGSGRPGADGGSAGDSSYGSQGGNGGQGTYFSPTQTYYGGGGCGVGSSYRHEWPYEAIDERVWGKEGTHGVTDNAYGHGGNALKSCSCSESISSPQPGAIIISLT